MPVKIPLAVRGKITAPAVAGLRFWIWTNQIQKKRRTARWQIHTMNNSNTSLPRFDPYLFGQRLQNTRRSMGITQEKFAEMLCVDRNHITRMERGVRVCSIDLLVDISAVLNVSIDYLLIGLTEAETVRKKLISLTEQLKQIAEML